MKLMYKRILLGVIRHHTQRLGSACITSLLSWEAMNAVSYKSLEWIIFSGSRDARMPYDIMPRLKKPWINSR